MDFLGCLGSLMKRAILFVCARASDLESGSAFEISNSKIKNLEKSSILFNMRSFLKEKMEKHVEDLWQFETTVFWSCQRKMFSDNLRSICVFSLVERRIYRTSASTSREIFRLARQAQVHFIRRRPRRICLACHAQIQVVRRRPRTISYRPPETVTLWRAQPAWGSAAAPPGKIRVRACAFTRVRVRVRVSVSLTWRNFMPSLEMFRDRIRGVYPPNSIPNLNKLFGPRNV